MVTSSKQERLPGKQRVDFDQSIKSYLSTYIHAIQDLVVTKNPQDVSQVKSYLNRTFTGSERIFDLQVYKRGNGTQFTATIVVKGLGDQKPRFVRISDSTNAGMRNFTIEDT
jgi:hypothetical protein